MPPSSHPPRHAPEGRRPAHLATRTASRRFGTVRRRAGRDARRDRASRLCSDRHDQRDRALPPSHPVDAHSRATGARICARPRASTSPSSNIGRTPCPMCRPETCRFFLPEMTRHRRQPMSWFKSGDERGSSQGPDAHPHGTARSPSATSTTTSWWRRTTPGPAESRRSALCNWRSSPAC